MKTNNSMQLKSIIKNYAEANKIPSQLVLQNYMLERLIERISISKYRNNFIIKGGVLISSIVGLPTRTTMDLDTTIKKIAVNQHNIEKIFNELLLLNIEDDVSFELLKIDEIREEDKYKGLRVYLLAK